MVGVLAYTIVFPELSVSGFRQSLSYLKTAMLRSALRCPKLIIRNADTIFASGVFKVCDEAIFNFVSDRNVS